MGSYVGAERPIGSKEQRLLASVSESRGQWHWEWGPGPAIGEGQ